MSYKQYNVSKVIMIGIYSIKLLEIPLKTIYNQNIICEGKNDGLVWQIQNIFEGIHPEPNSPFVNIEQYDNKKIKAFNFNGMQYYIHIESGFMELIHKIRY